jgi:hypothetical protein
MLASEGTPKRFSKMCGLAVCALQPSIQIQYLSGEHFNLETRGEEKRREETRGGAGGEKKSEDERQKRKDSSIRCHG